MVFCRRSTCPHSQTYMLLTLSQSYTIWFPHCVIRWHIVCFCIIMWHILQTVFLPSEAGTAPSYAANLCSRQSKTQLLWKHTSKTFPHKIADIYVHTFSSVVLKFWNWMVLMLLNEISTNKILFIICMLLISHFTGRHNGGTARGLRPGRDAATQRDYTPG